MDAGDAESVLKCKLFVFPLKTFENNFPFIRLYQVPNTGMLFPKPCMCIVC
jgi:hypothetical protein